MKKKRFIFDLDGTLLSADFAAERVYFYNIYGDKAFLLTEKMGHYLDLYEKNYSCYDEKILGSFLSTKSGLIVPDTVIHGWVDTMANVEDVIEDGVLELLEYLREEGHSLAVLTNWFGGTQLPRLEKSGLIDFFDDIYTGEQGLKPHRDSYQMATGSFQPEDCVMIGDNLEKDYIGPRTCDIESILYDKHDVSHRSVVKVKRMNEVIQRYEEE